MLAPAENWLVRWERSSSLAVRVALVAAALFIAIPTALGAALKLVGERFNPHSKIRAELLKITHEIRNLFCVHSGITASSEQELRLNAETEALSQMSSSMFEAYQLKTKFQDKILQEKHGASRQDLCNLGRLGIFGLVAESSNPQHLSPNFPEIEALSTRWEAGWEALRPKIARGESLEPEKSAVLTLASEDPEVHELARKAIEEAEAQSVYAQNLTRLSIRYAEFSAQLG